MKTINKVIGRYAELEEQVMDAWLQTLAEGGRLQSLLSMEEEEVDKFAEKVIASGMEPEEDSDTSAAPSSTTYIFQQNGQAKRYLRVRAANRSEAIQKVASGETDDETSHTEWFDGYKLNGFIKEVEGRDGVRTMKEYRVTSKGYREV
jgi:hypothetical protein